MKPQYRKVTVDCEACNGTGYYCPHADIHKEIGGGFEPCDYCDTCKYCDGTGSVEDEEVTAVEDGEGWKVTLF
jgi:hypothetical protein